MKIFAGHNDSGCGWYRMLLPLRELERHGHDVTFASARDGGITAPMMEGHDVIVAQQFDKHDGLGTWRRMRARARLVYETDDDVFNIETVNWAAYSAYSRADTQDVIAHSAQVANLVTVTCGPLAQVMREYNPDVAVLPNHIPGWVCDLPRQVRARPLIGWAGGASHGLDIQLVAAPLRRFLGRFPGWDAAVLGTDYRPTIRHPRTGFLPWIQVNDDPHGYYQSVDFDIGLAPLQLTKFNRSKSFLKCLEYGARGIPVIASDCEPYRDFVLHGVTGFLVKRDHEWLKYMSELASDEGLRASMSAKAREQARGWTIETGWKLWESAYKELVS